LKEGEIFWKNHKVFGKSAKSAKFLEKAGSFWQIRDKCKVFGKSTLILKIAQYFYIVHDIICYEHKQIVPDFSILLDFGEPTYIPSKVQILIYSLLKLS
jgi:hypothetical protein